MKHFAVESTLIKQKYLDEEGIDNWYRATGSSRSSLPAPPLKTAPRESEDAPRRTPARAPACRPRRPNGRAVLAIIAFNISVVGLMTEQSSHLCQYFFDGKFDPLGNAPNTLMFLLATTLLITNEWLLRRKTYRHDLQVASLIGTGIALGVTVTTAWFFGPLLGLSFVLVFVMGLGALIWVPYLALIVLVLQAKAICVRLDAERPSRSYGVLGIALLAALLTIACLVAEASCAPPPPVY